MESKVSVILPAYKAENTIKNAIKSVLNQTYKNIELIIIENGPKDETQQICDSFSLEDAKKILYFYTKDANVSNARNIGISKATGEYIAFIDADDTYSTDFIEKMIECIKEDNSELVTCGYKTVYLKKNILIKNSDELKKTDKLQYYLETLKEKYLFNEIWNKLYIADIIKQNKIIFNTRYELGEDFIFNLDYLKCIEKASYINEPLYIYTDGQDGLKLKYRPNKFDIEYALTKYLEKYYKEKHYSMEYIYNRFARIYYNAIIDIYKANNHLSKRQKNKELKRLINTKQYKEDLNFIKDKITDRKFKIAVKYFFLKGILTIKIFINLNKLRHKKT